MDQLAKLFEEIERGHWKTAYSNHYSKEVERHYRARLVRLLEQHGIGPIAVCPENDPVDLLINGYAVELKVARAHPQPSGGKKNRFQALLRDANNGHHLNGDYIILLAVTADDQLHPFIIPTGHVGDRKTIEITSEPTRYHGQWAPYLGAYDYLRGG